MIATLLGHLAQVGTDRRTPTPERVALGAALHPINKTMSATAQWFCLKAQTKREHIAADHVRQIPGTAVFLPRVRFQRKTVRGLAWFTEALFPGYVFARFNFQIQRIKCFRTIVLFG